MVSGGGTVVFRKNFVQSGVRDPTHTACAQRRGEKKWLLLLAIKTAYETQNPNNYAKRLVPLAHNDSVAPTVSMLIQSKHK